MAPTRRSNGTGSSAIDPPFRPGDEHLRLLIDSIREYAIFMLDPDGHVLTWNPGAERLKGYRADEIIGRHFSIFYPPAAAAAGDPARWLALALERGSVEFDEWRVRRDGSQFWAHVAITALRDAEGEHIGYAKVTRDMTDRRREDDLARRLVEAQLRESEQRFATFAQYLPGLAWIKDLDGRYIYVNDAAARAFGAPADAICGRTDLDLFPPETAAEFRENDRRAVASSTGIQAVERLRGDRGEIRHSIVSKFPIVDADGSFHLLGGIAIDITERVHGEEALRLADRRKNEFLATLSHELRNPLAPIRNAVHLLRSDAAGVSRERVFRLLENQIEYLVRLVDDLLEVSRITTGKVELRRETVDLRDIVRNAIDASEPAIVAKRHHLITDIATDPVTVDGDPVRLMQVVANVLNNAAKYTPEGGHIWLALQHDADGAMIRVRDDGLGIPAEMMPRVFDMFAQVDRTLNRAHGGLGIGLALARDLVRMHGGTIEGSSHGLDLGSEFVIRLPGVTPAPRPPASDPAGAGGAPRQRVLVVDDNRDGTDSLRLVLEGMGVEARAAYDGPSALGIVRGWRPSVVLLDIGMPGMDGYEVARRIREEPALGGVRLIALTGWGAGEDRRRTQDAGFDDHWVKPVDPRKLAELLTR